MAKFSERYGYTKVSDVLIRKKMTDEIQNAIYNCLNRLINNIGSENYNKIESYIWTNFLHQREDEFLYSPNRIIQSYLLQRDVEWYEKLDILEFTINILYKVKDEWYIKAHLDLFVGNLNTNFKRLNFAYRIINYQIVEITSEEEIKTIESAINNENDSVKHHFQKALELYAKKPTGDYQNSIKESISAVEAFTRDITGENVLNFKKLEDKGILLPPTLRQAFEKLYGYTNDKATGIRHALMDDSNSPKSEEALFMLVSCSAFINYLTKKKINE